MSLGALSSILLLSGYLLPALVTVLVTLAVIFLSERKSRNFREILQDKPLY
jgi:hypothetical protein